MRVALIWITEQPSSRRCSWTLGEIIESLPSVTSLAATMTDVALLNNHEALLIWDSTLGVPDETLIRTLIKRRVDVWHSGLKLGVSGKPELFDFVKPTWMYNRDPDPDNEATSWRLSLRACLIRCAVLTQLGGIKTVFDGLESAGLEFGLRCLESGVIIRHLPELANLQTPQLVEEIEIPVSDQVKFIELCTSRKFVYWAVFRSIVKRQLKLLKGFMLLWHKQHKQLLYESRCQYQHSYLDGGTGLVSQASPRVTVLIPTLNRYPYLKTILNQLRRQTIPPIEIIVVDQTSKDMRDTTIVDEFADLPLKVIHMDIPGQCSSRNLGLRHSQGDYVLFLDDDDEITESVIELHLNNIYQFQACSSSGSVDEVGALPLTDTFRLLRLSDVFPTNNTLVSRSALTLSGLFDMAYERKQSEDGDLGMRLYLAGAVMIYDPRVIVLHHRAPVGGLRSHKARVITYSSSRQRLLHRRFPHISEVYLMKRYFTGRQVHEALLLSLLGTFSVRGSMIRRMLKVVIGLMSLPNSVFKLRGRARKADKLLERYPDIPFLDGKREGPFNA